MNVVLTFEPSGITGVVAAGTYLIDASRRLGVSLGQACTRGSEDHSCLVSVKSGADLLSPRSAMEERLLSASGLDASYRLACQVKIANPGELTVNVTARTVGPTSDAASDADVRRKFGELSLNKKIATLMQLEAITMSEALDAAIEKPLSLGTRALDSVMKRARAHGTQEKQTGNTSK